MKSISDLPLIDFLMILSSEGVNVSVHDLNKLLLAFSSNDEWNLNKLKNVVTAIVAKNEHQQAIIYRRFDIYFGKETLPEDQIELYDIQKILADLRNTIYASKENTKTKVNPSHERLSQKKITKFSSLYMQYEKERSLLNVVLFTTIIIATAFFIVYRAVITYYPTTFISPSPQEEQVVESKRQISDQIPEETPSDDMNSEMGTEENSDSQLNNTTNKPNWKQYFSIACISIFLIIIIVKQKKRLFLSANNLKYNDDKDSLFFRRSNIGGKPESWLDQSTIEQLADSMGYFRSNETTKKINIYESVKESIKSGGIPACVLSKSSKIRAVIILEDQNADAIEWNPVPKELAEGLTNCGIPLIYGKIV